MSILSGQAASEEKYGADVWPSSEKLMKLDAKRREYDIIVIGEEAHLAYNRVGLTSFFQHRKVENLYLNPKEWVSFNPHSNCNWEIGLSLFK